MLTGIEKSVLFFLHAESALYTPDPANPT